MSIVMRRTALAAMTAMAAALTVTPVLAAPFDAGTEPRTARVELGDLDLRQDQDVTRLRTRLRAAATSVCGNSVGRMDLTQQARIRTCRETTLANAGRHADAIIVAVRSGEDQRLAVRESLRVIAR